MERDSEFRAEALEICPGRAATTARDLSSWQAARHGPDSSLPGLHHAYQDIGGLVSGDALSTLRREHFDQPISLLARWVVNRQVLSFDVKGQHWLPMFQFDPQTLKVLTGIERVIGALSDVYDDAELALWFATPNTWLGDARPAAVIGREPGAVQAAARADRFVVLG